jgi:ammonium transporter, Amt family
MFKGSRNKLFAFAALAAFAFSMSLSVADAVAAEAAAAPDLAQRVADLEAYINNGAPSVIKAGPGHNAWMMTSTALVLFMTLPGLALFYGGLVRTKNILSVMAQCLGCAGLVTVLWFLVGYSFAFDAGSPYLGGTKFAMFNGITSEPNSTYAAWVSQNVFAMFQMMFAIITPALIVGAIAERMKY